MTKPMAFAAMAPTVLAGCLLGPAAPRVRRDELLDIARLCMALGGRWQPDGVIDSAAADTAAVVKTSSHR
jgi:hypothetical protein